MRVLLASEVSAAAAREGALNNPAFGVHPELIVQWANVSTLSWRST